MSIRRDLMRHPRSEAIRNMFLFCSSALYRVNDDYRYSESLRNITDDKRKAGIILCIYFEVLENMYIYICIYMCIYIYIYITSKRDICINLCRFDISVINISIDIVITCQSVYIIQLIRYEIFK